MAIAVQFGAGNIGRGFIAQLFHESDMEVIFVDVVEPVIKSINEQQSYTIHLVGEHAQDVRIDRIRAIHASDVNPVAEAIAECSVMSTAVGANALKYIAPPLAKGLALRYERSGFPLNILICENLHDAADYLRSLVASHLPDNSREEILNHTGFVQAVVSRMVPLQETIPGDIDIRAEAYKRLPVDGRSTVGILPEIAGVEVTRNFQAYVDRKLYTHNCAHAALGYLGFAAGIEYGFEALSNPDIQTAVHKVLSETGEALIKKHGFSRSEHNEHIIDLLHRFENRELGDTCFRLARDPLRKLAADDRLAGAARLCQEEGILPDALASLIGLAYHFVSSQDPSSLELQRRIKENGIEQTVLEVSGIRQDEPLGKKILESYNSNPAPISARN
jgi:mannitol-1-phosphate 5-dehydrogenase